MKKRNIILLIVLAIIVLIFVYYQVVKIQNKNKEIQKFNSEFEQYTTGKVYGTNIVTIINKAIDNNEKNNISKDDKKYYINDNEKYIGVELVMINNENNKTYKMEQISNFGIENFLQSDFNLIDFKCTNIEYHKNGRIAKIVFTQLEN